MCTWLCCRGISLRFTHLHRNRLHENADPYKSNVSTNIAKPGMLKNEYLRFAQGIYLIWFARIAILQSSPCLIIRPSNFHTLSFWSFFSNLCYKKFHTNFQKYDKTCHCSKICIISKQSRKFWYFTDLLHSLKY